MSFSSSSVRGVVVVMVINLVMVVVCPWPGSRVEGGEEVEVVVVGVCGSGDVWVFLERKSVMMEGKSTFTTKLSSSAGWKGVGGREAVHDESVELPSFLVSMVSPFVSKLVSLSSSDS
jgi:hypothetical protein